MTVVGSPLVEGAAEIVESFGDSVSGLFLGVVCWHSALRVV
jgi:hypothetical protein